MSEVWVVNASPLIALAKVGRLKLLVGAGREVVVPDAVAREVAAGPDDAATTAIRSELSGLVVPQADLPSVIEWGLGAGETAVLSAAIARRGRAVVDDREARSAANALGIPLAGTLGVVVLARSEGRIGSAAEVLHQMKGAGLRLDDHLVREALRRFADEDWKP